jgi:hypothetical protein
MMGPFGRRIGWRPFEWSPAMIALSFLLTVIVLTAHLVDFATKRVL